MATTLIKFNLELISKIKESAATPLHPFDDPENWEEEDEFIYREDWPGLLAYQEQIAKKRPNCIDEQWKLCQSYINNGLYEKALNYLGILYQNAPDDKNIIGSLVEVLLLLGLSENDFNFEKPPVVFRLHADLLDICYAFLIGKRKPEVILNLYCSLILSADYLDFEEVDLINLLKQDERFLINDQEVLRLTEVYINRTYKNKKTSGHYCWCCGRLRPNETFSGKNHGRHLCKECSKLGTEELKFRQIEVNIDRLIGWGEVIFHKNKKALEKYRDHKDERISRLVNNAFTRDSETRTRWKAEYEEMEEGESEYFQINNDHEVKEYLDDLPF